MSICLLACLSYVMSLTFHGLFKALAAHLGRLPGPVLLPRDDLGLPLASRDTGHV